MHFPHIFQHNKRRRRVKRKIQIRIRCNPLSNGFLCLTYKRNFVCNIFTCFVHFYIRMFVRRIYILGNSTQLYNCYLGTLNLHFIHIMFRFAWLCLYFDIFILLHILCRRNIYYLTEPRCIFNFPMR